MAYAATNQNRPIAPRRTRSEEVAAEAIQQGRDEATHCTCDDCAQRRLSAGFQAGEIPDPMHPLAECLQATLAITETPRANDVTLLFRLGVAIGLFVGMTAGVPIAFIALRVFA